MSSKHLAHVTVDPAGKAGFYQHQKLPDWEVLGTVTRGDDIGALAYNSGTGLYAMANAGVLRMLDQRKVRAALGIDERGRPASAGAAPTTAPEDDDMTTTRTTPHPVDARIVRDQQRANEWRQALYLTRLARHRMGLPIPLTLVHCTPPHGPQWIACHATAWLAMLPAALLVVVYRVIPR